jgi:hypothetical protein
VYCSLDEIAKDTGERKTCSAILSYRVEWCQEEQGRYHVPAMTRALLHLLPLRNEVAMNEVQSLATDGEVLACDFYIIGAETFPA